jgi:hypothetical protein
LFTKDLKSSRTTRHAHSGAYEESYLLSVETHATFRSEVSLSSGKEVISMKYAEKIILLVSYLVYYLTLNIEAKVYFEASIGFQWTFHYGTISA